MRKYFLILLLTTACTERIDLRNDGMEPMLVITCILTDSIAQFGEQENKVIISRTTPYFGSLYYNYVSGAKVFINSNALKMNGTGHYEHEEAFCGVPGQTYTLEVRYDVNGDGVDEIYTATTTIPQKYQLDSITLSRIPYNVNYMARLSLHFQDSIGNGYFGARLCNENNGIYYSNRILRYCIFPFGPFSKDDYHRILQPPDLDWIIRHQLRWDNEESYYIYAGDTLSVELEALSPEYHRYLEVAKTEQSQKNPLFSAPSANIPTNIKGGALGIFGAYTTSRASVVIPLDTPGLPVR